MLMHMEMYCRALSVYAENGSQEHCSTSNRVSYLPPSSSPLTKTHSSLSLFREKAETAPHFQTAELYLWLLPPPPHTQHRKRREREERERRGRDPFAALASVSKMVQKSPVVAGSAVGWKVHPRVFDLSPLSLPDLRPSLSLHIHATSSVLCTTRLKKSSRASLAHVSKSLSLSTSPTPTNNALYVHTHTLFHSPVKPHDDRGFGAFGFLLLLLLLEGKERGKGKSWRF